jgi:GNAT superfamily N-acetyltransferase
LKIRPATREDLPGILKALADLPVTTGEDEVFEIDQARAAPVIEKILAQEGRTILLAVDGAEVIGAADLIVVPNLTHDCSPWAMVENVVVSESRRGQGIGKALMEEAIRRAQGAGCYKVQLMSFKERKDAHEFYRALGFEPLAEGFRMYF